MKMRNTTLRNYYRRWWLLYSYIYIDFDKLVFRIVRYPGTSQRFEYVLFHRLGIESAENRNGKGMPKRRQNYHLSNTTYTGRVG